MRKYNDGEKQRFIYINVSYNVGKHKVQELRFRHNIKFVWTSLTIFESSTSIQYIYTCLRYITYIPVHVQFYYEEKFLTVTINQIDIFIQILSWSLSFVDSFKNYH